MKELRPGSTGSSELRILFAFDPARSAIMLVAGDKAGNWTRWCKKNIPLADDLFDDHLLRLRVIEMALSYEELLAKYPVDRAEIDRHKERMLAEVRAYRLRELREQAGLTQAQLAERIGVGQRQVSKVESGDLDSAKVGTIRRYLEAVGGGLAVEYVMGDQRVQVA